jgi:antitoxin CcdA
MVNTPRRATNVSLPAELVREARDLGVGVSRACADGLANAVREARKQRWLAENAEAIAAYNERIEREGPTLAAYRLF